jgi:predicted GNAT family acetyltransferase
LFRVRRLSAPEFVSEVVPALAERELENNLVIGLARRLAASPEEAKAAVLCSVELDGACVAGALWTPPQFVVVSTLPRGAEAALVEALCPHDRGPDGSCGPGDAAEHVARELAERVGGRVELVSDEVLYELTEIVPPHRPPGASRLATQADLPVVREFVREFFVEVNLPRSKDPDGVAARVVEERRALVWDDGGVRSLACEARRLVTGAAIAPVFTPRADRGRGYASALTADLCRSLLDAGRRFVCLHAERANATSNHIYQSIGFRAAGPFQVWAVR